MRRWLLVGVLVLWPETGRGDPPDAAVPPGPPHIEELVRDVSPKNIEASVRKLAGFKTRHTLSDTTSEEQGIGAARRWIKAELEKIAKESGGRLRVELDEFLAPAGQRVPAPTPLVNVVATLPGTQPEARDRLYVLSGHYDSRASDVMDATSGAPGANDDASGTAAMLEVARVMSRRSYDATLVFLAVAGEEQGLLGSTHWAAQAAARKLNVAGMITDDIIGNTKDEQGKVDRGRVRLFAEGLPPLKTLTPDLLTVLKTGGENDLPTRQLARTIKALGEKYVPGIAVNLIYRRDRYLRGGDHAPFLERGFPAVRFTEPIEDYTRQHQNVRTENGVSYGDVADAVDFGYVAQVARVNLAALAGLALAPAVPSGVEVETSRLENDTALHWQPNREPDLAGYRVVWRDTTAAQWQNQIELGKSTRFVVKGVSKDDVIFGVQAVDRDGNASPAAYPRPARP
jgi:Zn-dependent M28 family amino/carboxypeptidase